MIGKVLSARPVAAVAQRYEQVPLAVEYQA